ncbi:Hint domain-containing protein [Acetobacter persici]|uniref:Hint domain-containing protein n=1 Tax=Acetobacter persici TaxID=1076596 RepID=UPI00098D2033|nr:Hint domain-containing protein [Acetobacter persici]
MSDVISSNVVLRTTSSGITVVNGGRLNIVAPATAIDLTVTDGGIAYLWTGASAVDAKIDSGSFLEVYHAAASSTVINNAGRVSLQAASVLSDTVVNDGGELEIEGGGIATDSVVSSGGKITLMSGGFLSGTTSVTSGGEIDVSIISNPKGPVGGSGTIILDSGAKIVVQGRLYPTNVISAAKGAEIEFPYLTSVSTVTAAQNQLRITGQNSYGDSISYALNISDATLRNFVSTSSGAFIYEACFLPGTMIRTPEGETPVEALRVGDQILMQNKLSRSHTPSTIKWTGAARCIVRPDLPDDEAGYPVRILENAISDGIPSKDLLVTSEHCLFFKGYFVPVRMLVNGRSVFYDKNFISYDYYHIETEEHSVVIANGVLTESYLDTGNRQTFHQGSNVVTLHESRHLTWEDAAAPLNVSREFVEPLFRDIEKRANHTGATLRSHSHRLTRNPDFHLITDDGHTIRPLSKHEDRFLFSLPPGVKNIHLASNASRPCDVIGPFVDDRRWFGVRVGKIQLFSLNKAHDITDHLTHSDLPGWHGADHHEERWTSGRALLSVEPYHAAQVAFLAIQIKESGFYLLNTFIGGTLNLK